MKLPKIMLQNILTRVGTALAGVLVGSGVGHTEAEQIGVGVAALVLVLLDLVNDRFARRGLN